MIRTVASNLAGLHVAAIIPNGVKLCSECDLSQVMDPLLDTLNPEQQHLFRADTARIHTPNL
jgi:hypothetical protein